MRLALALCLVATVVGCGVGAAAPAEDAALTDLRITVWPEGRDKGNGSTFTLKCAPAHGSLPRSAAACTELLRMTRPFRPVQRDTFCTDLYGGPQQALVTGTLKGARVWALFSATDGCQIARAKRIGFLLPGFTTVAGA
ncbi:MAG TPA: SSI family serine proteinase inhibitor [Gaiellaceae bacterium]|nr:SSI family serine proteinase inhibitor [Gaiellaceae bacterium]